MYVHMYVHTYVHTYVNAYVHTSYLQYTFTEGEKRIRSRRAPPPVPHHHYLNLTFGKEKKKSRLRRAPPLLNLGMRMYIQSRSKEILSTEQAFPRNLYIHMYQGVLIPHIHRRHWRVVPRLLKRMFAYIRLGGGVPF